MARKLLLLALGAAAAAYVISSRRRPWVGDLSGNGRPSRRRGEIRRLVGEVRGRLQAPAPE